MILVFDNGEIVERGVHAELIERNELYAALWRRQSQTSGDNVAAAQMVEA